MAYTIYDAEQVEAEATGRALVWRHNAALRTPKQRADAVRLGRVLRQWRAALADAWGESPSDVRT